MLEQNLNELNIFALRDLARRTGVSSPTSKKKEVLIKEIVEIVSGDKEPLGNKPKQGRPPKVFGYDFANVFTNNLTLGAGGDSLTEQVLNRDLVEAENEEVLTVAGWLEVVNNNSALLWVEKNYKTINYFVPSEVLKKLEVRMGDRVVAEVFADDNSRVVKKIFSVNDYPIMQNEVVRKNYEEVEHILPNKYLEFENKKFEKLKLLCGEDVFVYGNNNNNNTKKIIEILNSCKIENKIYINVSLVEKNKIFLKSLMHSENFVSSLTDDSTITKRIVSLAIERAKRILEMGEDVLIVVDDLNSVMSIDEFLAKGLVSIVKNSNKGSITLLSVMPNFGMNQVEKLADRRLKIENDSIEII